jgi:hypothetical protein
MSKQDKVDPLINQTTVAIVIGYLERMKTAINQGISGTDGTGRYYRIHNYSEAESP